MHTFTITFTITSDSPIDASAIDVVGAQAILDATIAVRSSSFYYDSRAPFPAVSYDVCPQCGDVESLREYSTIEEIRHMEGTAPTVTWTGQTTDAEEAGWIGCRSCCAEWATPANYSPDYA